MRLLCRLDKPSDDKIGHVLGSGGFAHTVHPAFRGSLTRLRGSYAEPLGNT
ncbi:hypothetical protein [Desulfosporosinus acidiphilus]|uniref:hypothetical protein n=1 Tax=Desulfosporosinus acidiphilus TaxID=885581 RepID=UPI0013052BA5|nr:hypothetical protein [Desulfosporosinus acidiphilus]